MGVLCKVVDATLLLVFAVVALVAPLIGSQTLLPPEIYPELILDLRRSYIQKYEDYLLVEKLHFYVGLLWLELLFQWPLALLNIYGVLTSKPWFKTTCVMFGVSLLTSMAAILGELLGSGKASDNLLMMHYPFMGFGVLAMLRGLVPGGKSSSAPTSKKSAMARKKRA